MKNLLFTFLCFFLPFLATAQTTLDSDEVVFYGLDFSKSRMVGSFYFDDIGTKELTGYLFEAWNDLMLIEKDKYSISKFFYKDHVKYNFEIVRARNKNVDEENLIKDSTHELDEATIKEVVQAYEDEENKDGLGLIFVVESFDRIQERGYIWATFFDIASKEVLLAKRMEGEVGGSSNRNFWARSIITGMEQWFRDNKEAQRKSKRKRKKG